MINSMDIYQFSDVQNSIFNNIENLNLKVSGNIDETLIRSLYGILKSIQLKETTLQMPKESLKQENPLLITYYQKSSLFYSTDNSVLIAYGIDVKYKKYSIILQKCFFTLA